VWVGQEIQTLSRCLTRLAVFDSRRAEPGSAED